MFRGYNPFSEKETIAARDWVEKHKDSIVLYIDFHAYGQLWMTPFGYSLLTPSNEMEMVLVNVSHIERLKKLNILTRSL